MTTEEQVIDYAKTLELVNYEIAELSSIKEQIEKQLFSLINHPEDASKSYVFGKYKVTLSTGYNYSLNKDEYLIVGATIPKCFNPVKQKTAYELDKHVIREAERYASSEELALLAKIISKKPKKLHVKIGASV